MINGKIINGTRRLMSKFEILMKSGKHSQQLKPTFKSSQKQSLKFWILLYQVFVCNGLSLKLWSTNWGWVGSGNLIPGHPNLIPDPTRYPIRSNTKHKVRTNFGSRAFANYGPAVWNNLPTEIRLAPSVAIFKRKLKKYWFQQAYGCD